MAPPDVHRDPDELLAAARAVGRVLDDLRPLLAAPPAGQEQVRIGAARVVAELERLEAGARQAAAVAAADDVGVRDLRRAVP